MPDYSGTGNRIEAVHWARSPAGRTGCRSPGCTPGGTSTAPAGHLVVRPPDVQATVFSPTRRDPVVRSSYRSASGWPSPEQQLGLTSRRIAAYPVAHPRALAHRSWPAPRLLRPAAPWFVMLPRDVQDEDVATLRRDLLRDLPACSYSLDALAASAQTPRARARLARRQERGKKGPHHHGYRSF